MIIYLDLDQCLKILNRLIRVNIKGANIIAVGDGDFHLNMNQIMYYKTFKTVVSIFYNISSNRELTMENYEKWANIYLYK